MQPDLKAKSIQDEADAVWERLQVSIALVSDDENPSIPRVLTVFGTGEGLDGELVETDLTEGEFDTFIQQSLAVEARGSHSLLPSARLLHLLGVGIKVAIQSQVNQAGAIKWLQDPHSDAFPVERPRSIVPPPTVESRVKARELVMITSPGDTPPEVGVRFGPLVRACEGDTCRDRTLSMDETLMELFHTVRAEAHGEPFNIPSGELASGLLRMNNAKDRMARDPDYAESLARVLSPEIGRIQAQLLTDRLRYN